jgi:two-component system cell cycle sensor histidine kinase/response regulator CckA
MKLQHKAWALVLAIIGLAALLMLFGARYAVSETFAHLESDRTTREGERARRMLDQQLSTMSATVKDYAYWVDAVEFANGQKEAFMEDNFDASNLGYLQISEVMVFDSKARLLASVTVLPDGKLGEIAPQRVQQFASFVEPVLADPSGLKVVQTYAAENERLDMLSVAAIRNPGKPSQTPQGAVVMVRRFDDQAIERFSNVLMVPVRLSFDQAHGTSLETHLVGSGGDGDELHTPVGNADGVAVVDLVLTVKRDLEAVGRTLAWITMAIALAFGLLTSVALVLLLDRLILRRLQRLHSDVQTITEQGASGQHEVRVQGADEISRVGAGVNRLLARVRADALAQQAAHVRQEELQIQLMQSQKTEALGRFTSGIAHDFNNSLAAIGGWVRVADEDLDPKHSAHEALQQSLKAIRYAHGLMRQLLAFSRQSPPRLEPLQVQQIIDESRGLLSSGLLRSCSLEIALPHQPVWVKADLTQMQQVLVNLVMNAADAMDGQGTVHLSMRLLDLPVQAPEQPPDGAVGLPDGRYVGVSVRDEGTGILPEHISRVFDPFFTTKALGRGTGLGLSVAHGIMSRHGGAIGVSSKMNAGTTMHLYLPQIDAAEAPLRLSAPVATTTVRRVLFVDDDQLVRHAWAALLERQGWLVTRARDGEEAWALFQRGDQQWDVVLTDLAMPLLDGISLAKRIRATESPPPIILMSGNVGADDAAMLAQTDFVAVLHKPVEFDELDGVLQAAIGRYLVAA